MPCIRCLERTVWAAAPRQCRIVEVEKGEPVKKLVILAVVALGGFLVWRKVQADRAELDLWTEATSAEN